MRKLPSTLQAGYSGLKPWHYIALAVLVQLVLLAAFVALQNSRASAPETNDGLELIMVVISACLMIALVAWLAYQQKMRFETEDRIRQRLLDVIDAVPDPSAVRDIQGRYVLWNKAAEAYHGIKAQHVIGKTPFELFPEPVAQKIVSLDHEAMQTNATVVRRVALPPLYGKGQRTAQIRVAPIHSVSHPGQVRGAVTILHDVTESEREASALQHLSAQLKMALDTSGFGSWIWDLESDVLHCSEQFQHLLKYRGKNFRQDFIFRERLHPDDRDRVLMAVKTAIDTNEPFQERYRLLNYEGIYTSFMGSGQSAQDTRDKRYFAGLLVPNQTAV